MAIGNLRDRLSSDDIAKVNEKMNPPEYKAGYEGGDDLGGQFDDIFSTDLGTGSGDGVFDSLGGDDVFGGSGGGDDLFGGGSSGGSSFGGNDFFAGNNNNNNSGGNNFFAGNNNNGGGNNFFAGNNNGGAFGTQGGGLYNMSNPNGTGFQLPGQQAQATPSMFDRFTDYSAESIESIGHILLEMIKSVGTRNVDDFGYLSNNCVKCGFITMAVGVVLSIVGWATKIPFLSLGGLGSQLVLGGTLTAGSGLIGLGISAYVLVGLDGVATPSMDQIPDASSLSEEEDVSSLYEDNLDATLDALFGDEDADSGLDDIFGNEDEDSDIFADTKPEPVAMAPISVPKIDFGEAADKVEMAGALTREKLFNTFKDFMVQNTPEFAIRTEITPGSEDFLDLSTVCMKALANIQNVDVSEINSKLERAYDTYFSFELIVKRVRKLNNTDQIAGEIQNYMRSSSSDTSVNATVTIEGDNYKIIVTKGKSAIVTFGDVFQHDYCKDFFMNTKNKLPIITGITELGNVILDDAKNFDTMLIAGKPRSGKSWYVFAILMSLMMFNTPKDVQFVIVDPKESNLFKTLALMPHVCGLHNDKYILDLLDDIIINEGARRKKILADNRVDDIWALREKGVELPVLYLVIDEYITVKNNLGEAKKDLDNKIQTIISQLPSQGIRLIFVPHRATGVVDKTNRTMLQFKAAVRAENEDVKDTLDIKKWDRSLTNPGDIAIKTSSLQEAIYIRGAALTTSDGGNGEMMKGVAKAFYKLGAELPDMSSMKVATNRVEGEVIRELGLSRQYYSYETANPNIDQNALMGGGSKQSDFDVDVDYNIKDFMNDFNI